MNSQLQYEYADGSGNVYLLTGGFLEYVPVTPERSSSGKYSGGEPKKVTVSDLEFGQLSALFEKAIANVSAHQANREMMTGLIKAGSANVILKKDSQDKIEIEKALKKLLDR